MIVQLDLHESKGKECNTSIERLDNRRKKASEDSRCVIWKMTRSQIDQYIIIDGEGEEEEEEEENRWS